MFLPLSTPHRSRTAAKEEYRITRFENRVRLAKLTKTERRKECPPGLHGLARERYIEHGLSLADQIHMASVTRIAAEESQEDTMSNATTNTDGFTIKAAAKKLGISRKTVKAFAAALELSKPFSDSDMERLAARKLAQTPPAPAQDAPAPKRTKAEKVAAIKEQPASPVKGKATPAQVAVALNVTPFEVRRAARAAKLTKQGKGWSFGKRDITAITKQLAA